MVPVILRKLEANAGISHGYIHASQVLNSDEFCEARLMIRAAVEYVNQYLTDQYMAGKNKARFPHSFKWRNSRLPLSCSNFLGQVFIKTKSGARVIASGYGAIL